MAGVDPQRMTQRYLDGVQATPQRYVEGVQNPRRDPVESAVRAAGKWANRTQEAIRNRSYEAGVRNQDRAEAVRIATEDGGAAWAAGAQKRANKVARAFQVLAPLISNVSQQVQNMPQDTPEQREQRMLANLRHMREVGKQFRSRGGM